MSRVDAFIGSFKYILRKKPSPKSTVIDDGLEVAQGRVPAIWEKSQSEAQQISDRARTSVTWVIVSPPDSFDNATIEAKIAFILGSEEVMNNIHGNANYFARIELNRLYMRALGHRDETSPNNLQGILASGDVYKYEELARKTAQTMLGILTEKDTSPTRINSRLQMEIPVMINLMHHARQGTSMLN